MKTVWRFLNESKIELALDPKIQHNKLVSQRDICILLSTAALLLNSQSMETTQVPINWMNG
jgi:hypothetical protein